MVITTILAMARTSKILCARAIKFLCNNFLKENIFLHVFWIIKAIKESPESA